MTLPNLTTSPSNISTSPILLSGSDAGSRTERYLLISWCSIVLLGCLVGNSIILLAALRCNTIRLDRISLILIKYIALSDIAMGIVGVHPTLVSLLHGTWPYGGILCNFFHFMQIPVYESGVLLICGLHLSKLHIVLYPLHAATRTSRTGNLICAAVWVLCTVVPASQLAIDSQGVTYDYRTYRCIYSSNTATWRKVSSVLGAVFLGCPTILVAGTTAALLFLVKKVKGRLNKQGIMVALYVGCLYLLANFPLFVYLSIISKVSHQMSPKIGYFFEFYFQRTSYFLMFTNCFCNFFVYYHSVQSFNKFVKRAFLYLLYTRKTRLNATMKIIRLKTVKRRDNYNV